MNNNEVLSRFNPSLSNIFDGLHINQELSTLTNDNYNIIEDSTYNGPITFDATQTSLEKAESIKNNYSIAYTNSGEVDTIILGLNNYFLEELRAFFETLIGN